VELRLVASAVWIPSRIPLPCRNPDVEWEFVVPLDFAVRLRRWVGVSGLGSNCVMTAVSFFRSVAGFHVDVVNGEADRYV
jgi:hypothetical protein